MNLMQQQQHQQQYNLSTSGGMIPYNYPGGNPNILLVTNPNNGLENEIMHGDLYQVYSNTSLIRE
jgi:hypothetical protein